MDAPPIQYVKTSDGYDIAYCVCGEGEPFVFVPGIFSHLSGFWRDQAFRSLLEPLASRFKLIQYDGRGQGDSQRGLPASFSFRDYVKDLDAVIEHLHLERVIVYAYTHACHPAVLYSARRPEHVKALILANPIDMHSAFGDFPLLELARRPDWEGFLVQWNQYSGYPEFLALTRHAANQADFIRALDASPQSDITDVVPSLTMPTLIITSSSPPGRGMVDTANSLATSISEAQRVVVEGVMGRDFLFSDGVSEPKILPLIDNFVANLPSLEEEAAAQRQHGASPDDLSERELEVLRLLAKGKSNPEIAKELFITRNTVQNHVGSILTKTNLNNRTEAAVYARDHGLA